MFNENICQTPVVAGRVKHIRRKLLAIARQFLSQSVVIGKALQGIGQRFWAWKRPTPSTSFACAG